MHADAAFNRTLADLDLDRATFLANFELGITVVYQHILEERLLSANISTVPTSVETYK